MFNSKYSKIKTMKQQNELLLLSVLVQELRCLILNSKLGSRSIKTELHLKSKKSFVPQTEGYLEVARLHRLLVSGCSCVPQTTRLPHAAAAAADNDLTDLTLHGRRLKPGKAAKEPYGPGRPHPPGR